MQNFQELLLRIYLDSLTKYTLTGPLTIMVSQIDICVSLVKYVWPFYNIMHERVKVCPILFVLDVPGVGLIHF